PGYLATRRALMNPSRAQDHFGAGTPPNQRQGAFGHDATVESVGTSQVSVVDDAGNAFSMTTSIEQSFGSRTMVRGFMLNNQLTHFSFLPPHQHGAAAGNT